MAHAASVWTWKQYVSLENWVLLVRMQGLIFQKIATAIFILNKCVILNLHSTKFLYQNSVTVSYMNNIATWRFFFTSLMRRKRPLVRPSFTYYQRIHSLSNVHGTQCKMLSTQHKFLKISGVIVRNSLRTEINFYSTSHISWPIWMRYGTDNNHVMPLSKCEFHENRFIERHAFLNGLIFPVFRTFFLQCRW